MPGVGKNVLVDIVICPNADEQTTIEIANTRKIPVTIEVTRDFGTNYWTLQSETPYENYDVTRARFNLNVEPRTKREIEYTVTTYQGTRQDQFNK